MKSYLFLFLCCGILSTSFVQSNLLIEYDEAGNRINRKIVVTPISNSGSNIRLADTLLSPIPEGVLSVYPNPSRYYVNVEFSNVEDSDIISYQLIDEQGRFVTEGRLKQRLTKLDISNQPIWIYFLNINRNEQKSQWKIVKIG